MKNYRIIKGKKIHVNQIASISRKYSVRNNTIPQTELNKKNIVFSWSKLKLTKYDTDTYGHMFEIDKDGHYHSIQVDHSWKKTRCKQPPTEWLVVKDTKPTRIKSTSFHKDPKKMGHIEYMEKLVEHKLAKWERKHPKPQDMFVEEVEKWMQERENAKERLRDFVVSIYDKLKLIGRFKLSESKYEEEKIAELKDINGDGHRVNEVSKDSKLIQKAQKITDETKVQRPNLVSSNLKDHKQKRGRVLLPAAA